MLTRRVLSRALPLALAILALPAAAPAQDVADREPIGRFVADARGALPRFKQDPNIASAIDVVPANLATRGLGFVVGAHVYPLRVGRLTLGLGAEALASRGSRTLEAAVEGGPDGPTARTRFSALSPQVSFNFGKRNGWSYISGGLGWATFSVEREPAAAAPDESTRRKTINYGGGARWFAKEHLAVSLDLRFYAVSPQTADATRPAMPRMTLMVFSAGVSFK